MRDIGQAALAILSYISIPIPVTALTHDDDSIEVAKCLSWVNRADPGNSHFANGRERTNHLHWAVSISTALYV
jgi:hypothetical protein